MNDEPTPTAALALPVELPVRPCAWTLQTELDSRETTCRAHLWFSDPVNSAWAPLYDQAALDAAVEQANARQNAAWRLMCDKMVAAERERGAKLRRLLQGAEVLFAPLCRDATAWNWLDETRAALADTEGPNAGNKGPETAARRARSTPQTGAVDGPA